MMDVQMWLVIGLTLLVGLILFFSGRLRERYGELRPSGLVTRTFERYELNPDMVYYTSGSDVFPHALIGIDRHFILDSDQWKKRDFNPETFREMIQNMQAGAQSCMRTLHGFEILDQRNLMVGSWFSLLDARTTIKMLADNRIRVDTPPMCVGSADY